MNSFTLKKNVFLLMLLGFLVNNAFAQNHWSGSSKNKLVKNLNQNFKGQNLLKLKQLFQIGGSQKAKNIESVIIVASSKAGHGKAMLISKYKISPQKNIGIGLNRIKFNTSKSESQGKLQILIKGNIYVKKIILKLKSMSHGRLKKIQITKKLNHLMYGPKLVSLKSVLGHQIQNKKILVNKVIIKAQSAFSKRSVIKVLSKKGVGKLKMVFSDVASNQIINISPTPVNDLSLKIKGELDLYKISIIGIELSNFARHRF